ncbi:MAG: replication-associated recombination protein A [Clostridia bacterium]|nr:replication-associated recombination protein A [Clostridia bacterium]
MANRKNEGQNTFFTTEQTQPLASRLRPHNLDEFVGQEHLVGEGKVLRKLIESDSISSMIFWGPPGVGKTTLARIIASSTRANFIDFSAVTSGIKEIKQVMQKAEDGRRFGEKTILFVDEIHRFNKAQQDAFLPYVEKGSIILIGATTENPSFEVNNALLSRCKVFVLQPLTTENIVSLLKRAIESKDGFGDMDVQISDDDLYVIANFANGDARTALSTLEMVILNGDLKGTSVVVSKDIIEQCISKKSLLYDKDGEEHYNLISALHKSMRNSDPDAAVYWLARMLEAGEDPLYVARRITRFASEDIGLADPRALEIAIAAYQACHYIGMPECSVHLTEAVVYMSLAPKSNALYMAYEHAKTDAIKQLADPVPLVIRNAPTRLMKDLDYGKGYEYAHDTEDKLTTMQCLPDSLLGREYYKPTDQGLESRFKERFQQIKEWKKAHSKDKK